MTESGINVTQVGHVLRVVIDRQERRNAIDSAARRALIAAFVQANTDLSVRMLVLTGAGDRAFCSGADLKEVGENSDPAGNPMSGPERNLYEVLLETYKPTLAVLNGATVGAGLELALACDLRIAADHAVLGLPEVTRGLGANAANVLLFRTISRSAAFELLYTGDLVSAERAYELGLLNQVVPADELASAEEQLTSRILRGAPLTLQRYKHIAVKSWGLPVPVALRLDAGPDPYSSEDRVEGVRAFLERRDPVWRNR